MKRCTNSILLLALLAVPLIASGQEIMGKDFWVSFIPTYNSSFPKQGQKYFDRYFLLATSSKYCTGRVSNPNTGWSDTFMVSPEQPCKINVPFEEAFPNPGEINNTGIHVWTSDTVSLYAFSPWVFDKIYQHEATLVIPTNKLGDEYYVQTASAIALDKAVLSILAVKDSTVVDIMATCNAANSGPQVGSPFSITLNAGQCYYIRSRNASFSTMDFTGTHVKARDGKPIAVSAGNLEQCNYGYWDHFLHLGDMLMEQMPPVRCGGKTFIIMGDMNQKRDSVRVTALRDQCVVFRDGKPKDTLCAGETYQYRIPYGTEAELVTTSQPAQAGLFNIYRELDRTETQRAIVNIDPLEQGIRKTVFTTITDPKVPNNYINIALETANKYNMMMDGNNISNKFKPLPHNNGYSYAKIKLNQGQHTLSNSSGPFVAQVYGGRIYQSGEKSEFIGYAFSVGSMMHDLSAQILVDDFFANDYPQGLFFCEDETPEFHLFTDFQVSRAEWDFGDGDTATGDLVPHHFPGPGVYKVSCEAYTLLDGHDSLAASLQTIVHIQQSVENDVWEDVCDGYEWNGQLYTTPGVHTQTLRTVGGCDSIVNLHLTVRHGDTVYYNASTCDDYLWHDSLYSQPGNHTHFEGTNLAGCDSIAVLHLYVKQDPFFIVKGHTQVAYATDIWPGLYRYYAVDSTRFGNDKVEWSCSNPEWVVTPVSDFSCTVFVRASGQGKLTATSTRCQSTASIYLNATPFGVDEEHDTKVELRPNPANDELTVLGNDIHEAVIYDLLGQRVASTGNEGDGSLHIHLESFPRGVYLVEIQFIDGNKIMEKIIIQ